VSAESLLWLVLWAPFVACVVITCVTQRSPRTSAWLALIGIVSALLATCLLWLKETRHALQLPFQSSLAWITLPDLTLEFGLLLDPLALLMLFVVTGVGSLIFLYSIEYMRGDSGYSRYFASLSLFAFAMLGIVLANNWITLFMFWELVGLSSYLLIGHWFEKPSAAEAGKKAFLVNRVADVGFLIGILFLWGLTGASGAERTFNFVRQTALIEAHTIPPALLVLVGLLIFCGVVGKSAQFPLHVWLPDAMEGPTPVSALIHAATMVAAGVYLLSRAFFLFVDLPAVLSLVAWIGGLTACFAALIALVQSDLKRILAYSTLSQLGYMVMALGLGGYVAGMYHLTTHAFFKALLFLAAGSVIHALHEQEIWKMGGLAKTMPITTWTFAIGAVALCGIPPLSGFFSKDEILTLALHKYLALYVLGTLTAGLTAFYMGRVFFVAFVGRARAAHHPHEAPPVMTLPLICLAALSLIGGFIGIPHFIHHHRAVHVEFHAGVAITSTLVALLGLGIAYLLYVKLPQVPRIVAGIAYPAYRLLVRKLFVDEFYDGVVKYGQGTIAWLCALFERWILIGLAVNGVASVTRTTGQVLRLCQTGRVQTYGLAFVIGVVGLLWYFLRRS